MKNRLLSLISFLTASTRVVCFLLFMLGLASPADLVAQTKKSPKKKTKQNTAGKGPAATTVSKTEGDLVVKNGVVEPSDAMKKEISQKLALMKKAEAEKNSKNLEKYRTNGNAGKEQVTASAKDPFAPLEISSQDIADNKSYPEWLQNKRVLLLVVGEKLAPYDQLYALGKHFTAAQGTEFSEMFIGHTFGKQAYWVYCDNEEQEQQLVKVIEDRNLGKALVYPFPAAFVNHFYFKKFGLNMEAVKAELMNSQPQ